MPFTLHTLESAPDASQPLLQKSRKAAGFLPNLHRVMAESPQVLEAYQELSRLFQATGFNADELTVIWQAINVEHGCHYCVPAHTAIAHMMKVDPALTEALRNEAPLPDARLQTLKDTTLELVRNRGHLSDTQKARFLEAGYTERDLLNIVLGIAQKVMSNYINHLADTPVDEPFQKFIWEKKA
ncbi:MAG: carboxymuconolactone decarboxylase family protein [Gammaproteobacteria bacterium]|nr:MAG: carboxymuconolactone decarboxylase family protein [Gammaproteobacteria bacterium]